MKNYRVTRIVTEMNWVVDQHVSLSDADAKKWLDSGAIVLFPVPKP